MQELVMATKHFLSSFYPSKSSDINPINFVREGKKPKTTSYKELLGISHSASDYTKFLTRT